MITERPKYIAPAEKILFHPDLIADVEAGRKRVPRHFEFDPTYRCNLACDGCHFAYTHESPGDFSKDITVDLFQKIVCDMSQNDVRAMTFTGGGEPLFHPQHLKLFQLAKDAGLKMGMYTNGVLLEGGTAEFVARNFEWCYISLDATNGQEYREYKRRGQVVFEKNVRNIREVVSLQGRKATIGVGYLVSKDNFYRLPQTISWLLNLGTDFVQLRPLVDVGTYQEQRVSRKMQGLGFQTEQQKWQEHYSWVPEALNVIDKFENTPRLETSRQKFTDLFRGQRLYPVCLSTSLSSAIGPLGEVWLCVNHRQLTQIGDLKVETLAEIFTRKDVAVDDLTNCRLNCRNDQLNQALWAITNNGKDKTPPTNSSVSHRDFI